MKIAVQEMINYFFISLGRNTFLNYVYSNLFLDILGICIIVIASG